MSEVVSIKPLSEVKYGRLTIIGPETRKGPKVYVLCKCECGERKQVERSNLRNGHTKSCGCLSREATKERNATHGQSRTGKKTTLFTTWSTMRQRCENPKHPNFDRYGGRGIRVCDRWQVFENFLDDMGNPENGQTIDRINNERGYEPGNCRWADRKSQTRNTRRNVTITMGGRTQCVAAWAEEIGIKYHTLLRR